MLRHELAARAEGHASLAGVDEAGRGPLAGPVVAAAVSFDWDWLEREGEKALVGLTDSKKLSLKRREFFYSMLTEGNPVIRWSVGEASVEEIERLNILRATYTAMGRALRGLGRFRREHFGAWLFRIARNWLIDEGRKRRPELSLDGPAGEEEAGRTLGDTVASEGARPDEASARRDLGRRIRAASEELPEEQREVFWLRMETGMSFKEIAVVQGCSINTALARMQYALGKMKRLLAEEWKVFCGGAR